MEIDAPPDGDTLSPRDRIVQVNCSICVWLSRKVRHGEENKTLSSTALTCFVVFICFFEHLLIWWTEGSSIFGCGVFSLGIGGRMM